MAKKENKIKSFADIAKDPELGKGAAELYGSEKAHLPEDINNSIKPGRNRRPGAVPVMLTNRNSGVTPAEERFCHEYIKTGLLRESYEKAGLVPEGLSPQKMKYVRDYGVRNFFMSKRIQNRLQVLLAAETIKLKLTPDSIAEKMLKIYERAMEIDDLRNANTTLENLAKYLGMFQNHTIVNVQNNTQINTVALDDTELDDHIQQLVKAATAERLERATIPKVIDVTPNQSG